MQLIYSVAFVIAIMHMGQLALGAPPAMAANIGAATQASCVEPDCDTSSGHDKTSPATVRATAPLLAPDVLSLLCLGLVALSVVARRRSSG